jgi:hypothetical protein
MLLLVTVVFPADAADGPGSPPFFKEGTGVVPFCSAPTAVKNLPFFPVNLFFCVPSPAVPTQLICSTACVFFQSHPVSDNLPLMKKTGKIMTDDQLNIE